MKSIVEKAREIVTHLYERNMVSWNDLDREVVFTIQALNAEVQRMEALAQPEQEPVARVEYIPCCTNQTCSKCKAATPPQRTWVGLADYEIYSVLENLQVMYNRPPTTDSRIIFARAIEAKLKEKNT